MRCYDPRRMRTRAEVLGALVGIAGIAGGALAVAAIGACSGGGADRPPDASTRGVARIQVVLEGRGPDVTVGVRAAFLRYHAISREHAELVAGAPRRLVPSPGRCLAEDDEAALDVVLESAPPEADVELLDAGELVIAAPGLEHRVAPRYLPGLLPFVAGVAYGGVAAPTPTRPEGDLIVSAEGGGEVDRFDGVAPIPAWPVPVIDGEVGPQELELAGAPRRLEVGWLAEGAGTLSIVVEGVAGEGERLRCWPAAAQGFTLPSEALALLARGGSIALERAIRVRLDAPGLPLGSLEIVAREVVPVQVW